MEFIKWAWMIMTNNNNTQQNSYPVHINRDVLNISPSSPFLSQWRRRAHYDVIVMYLWLIKALRDSDIFGSGCFQHTKIPLLVSGPVKNPSQTEIIQNAKLSEENTHTMSNGFIDRVSERNCREIRHVTLGSLLGILCWYPIVKSNLRNYFEDR